MWSYVKMENIDIMPQRSLLYNQNKLPVCRKLFSGTNDTQEVLKKQNDQLDELYSAEFNFNFKTGKPFENSTTSTSGKYGDWTLITENIPSAYLLSGSCLTSKAPCSTVRVSKDDPVVENTINSDMTRTEVINITNPNQPQERPPDTPPDTPPAKRSRMINGTIYHIILVQM